MRAATDEIPEGNCRTCGYLPTRGWECLALQALHERPSGITHAGRCWNGRYPDDVEAQKFEQDRETEKQRQAEEQRQLRLAV